MSHASDDPAPPAPSATSALVLHTARLRLVAATPAILRADLAGPDALGRALGVAPPRSWPPDLLEHEDLERMLRVAEAPGVAPGWNTWYLVEPGSAADPARAVGVAGFGAPPGDDRTVTLGYAIVRDARRRGYATEATRALVAFALADPRVAHVVAETYPSIVASVRVLEKVGFRRVEGGSEPGVIRFAYP